MMAEIVVDKVAQAAALERIIDDGVRLIDLQFSDLTGGAKALTITADGLAGAFGSGHKFDGSALTGSRQIELDLYLHPDPETLVVFPRGRDGERRAQFSCSVTRRDGYPFAGDPRGALKRLVAQARDLGFDYRVGVEMEYYLLPAGPSPTLQQEGAGYFDIEAGPFAQTRDDVLTTLQLIGIETGGAHHETGPGQEELDMPPVDALRMADQLMTIRQVIRSAAQRNGLRATFMPKPFAEAPGSGLHIFQRLDKLSDGSDALRGHGGEVLSSIGRMVVAGQVAHAAGMLLVLCPTVNSYKRLNAGHRAPRHATWAHVSQASMIRIPAWSDDDDTALELRCPDPMANPYLALSVALATALDGIRSGEEPPEALDESFVQYDDVELQRLGIPRLPGTLGEAIGALAEDSVVQAALGDYITDQLLSVKRMEWEEYRRHVSPWELARYGDA